MDKECCDSVLVLSYCLDDTSNFRLQPINTVRSTLEFTQKWLDFNQERFFTSPNLFPRKNLLRCQEYRVNGNNEYHKKNYFKALEFYNKAITLAPIDDCYGLDELSRCYSNRSLILADLDRPESALIEIELAIQHCPQSNIEQLKKLLFRKLNLLSSNHLKRYEDAIKLISEEISIQSIELNEIETKFINNIKTMIEEKLNLKKLNTVNFETRSQILKKSLKSLRIPLLVKKDQALIERWLNNESTKSLIVTDLIRMNKENRLHVQQKVVEDSLLSLEHPIAMLPLENIEESHYCKHCLTEMTVFSQIHPCLHKCHLIYCSNQCRLKAWNQYHRLECLNNYSIEYLKPQTQLILRILSQMDDGFSSIFTINKEKNQMNPEFGSLKESFLIIIQWAMKQISPKLHLTNEQLGKLSLQAVLLEKFLPANQRAEPTCLENLFEILLLFEFVIYDRLVETINISNLRIDENLDFILELNYQPLIRSLNAKSFEIKQLEHLNEMILSNLQNIKKKTTIAIALYPLELYLSCDGDPNVEVLFNQTCRALRSQKHLKPADKLIRHKHLNKFDTNELVKKPSQQIQYEMKDNKLLEEFYLNQNYSDLLNKCFFLKLSIVNHLAIWYFNRKDFHQALKFNRDCLQIVKNQKDLIPSSKLEIWLMIRQVRIEFDYYTEDQVPLKDAVQLAKDCLIHSSEAMNQLYRMMVPVNFISIKKNVDMEEKKHSTIEKKNDWATENIQKDYLVPLLVELEDIMVACNMFIEQFANKFNN